MSLNDTPSLYLQRKGLEHAILFWRLKLPLLILHRSRIYLRQPFPGSTHYSLPTLHLDPSRPSHNRPIRETLTSSVANLTGIDPSALDLDWDLDLDRQLENKKIERIVPSNVVFRRRLEDQESFEVSVMLCTAPGVDLGDREGGRVENSPFDLGAHAAHLAARERQFREDPYAWWEKWISGFDERQGKVDFENEEEQVRAGKGWVWVRERDVRGLPDEVKGEIREQREVVLKAFRIMRQGFVDDEEEEDEEKDEPCPELDSDLD